MQVCWPKLPFLGKACFVCCDQNPVAHKPSRLDSHLPLSAGLMCLKTAAQVSWQANGQRSHQCTNTWGRGS